MAILVGAIFPLKADDEAKALLYEAKDITSKASFTSVTPIYKNGQLQKTVKMYRVVMPDGSRLEKVENLWPDLLKEAYISNKTETYVLLADSVTKVDVLQENRNIIYTSINELYNEGASYSVSEEDYHDIPCYKVTVKLPTDQASIDKLAVKFRNGASNAREHITTRFPFTKTYLVGTDDYFIYSCSFYNLDGKQILSYNWGKVDFKTPIDENIFKTPQGNIVQLNGNAEKLRYIRSLFNLPNLARNEDENAVNNIADESDKARDILFSAMKATEKASFKATCKVTKGGKEYKTIKTYHIVLPDGTLQERTEHTWWNSWKETFIPSKTGTYAIFDKTVVKTDMPIGSRQSIYKSVKGDVIEDASYSMTDGNYKGEPCYKITVKIPTDQTYVKERLQRIQRHSNKTEEELMKVLPFAKTFLVGQKNNFIYSCTCYNILGRRTSTEEWGTVTFNPSIDTTLFEPPKGVSALPAKTPKKFMQIKERCVALFKAAKR